MALVPQTLNTALVRAFDEAMKTYESSVQSAISAPGENDPKVISKTAREAAAQMFASIATPAIDAYIKSATVTVTGTNAPGQITLVPAPPPAPPIPLPTTTPGVVTGQGVIS